uniref:HMG box domain-containing protein n=1 Tax=Caenorhabditis japonica TaxID=281687 RepID=A0A8R1E2T9_CAEJA
MSCSPKMRPKKVDSTPEKLPEGLKDDIIAITVSEENTSSDLPSEDVAATNDDMPNIEKTEVDAEMSSRENSDSFTPPPALSPAYSVREDVEIRETSPPIVRMENVKGEEEEAKKEKEKKTYKKREKDAVPYLDPKAPKRNRSAYVHFIISRRASYSKATTSQRDINIGLAREWSNLGDEARKPFYKKAEDEKKEYVALMEVYKKTDSHKEFQQKRSDFVKTKKQSHTNNNNNNNRKRKRKREEGSEDEEQVVMDFPKSSVFCPLLNDATAATSSSSSATLQYSGPIFTPEFVSYNKTRDSYRRQMAIERSNVEHELEALHEHDMEVKIRKQSSKMGEIDVKMEETMRAMRDAFAGVLGAKDNLSDIEALIEWLLSILKLPAKDRKPAKEALAKYCKSVKK